MMWRRPGKGPAGFFAPPIPATTPGIVMRLWYAVAIRIHNMIIETCHDDMLAGGGGDGM